MRRKPTDCGPPNISSSGLRSFGRFVERLLGIFVVLAIATIVHYESPEEVRVDMDWIQTTYSEWSRRGDSDAWEPSRVTARSTTSSLRSANPPAERTTVSAREPQRSPELIPEPDYIDYMPVFTIESPPSTLRVDRDWSTLDRAVRSLPLQRSIETVVQSLDELTADDWERTRAVYVWLTANIAYDTVSFFGGQRGAVTPEEVFRSGTSVCQGYSDLFVHLATELGLHARTISGYAKGYGYRAGDSFASTNHAWNAVQIDGSWHLFDSTWGAGHVDGERFVRYFKGFWFDPHPDLFLQSHLPTDSAWQLAVRPITKHQYESEPYVPSFRFSALWRLGFSDEEVVEALYTDRELPEAYSMPGHSIEVLNAPLAATVTAGQLLTFKIKAVSGVTAALINNGDWSYLSRSGDYLFGSLVPSAGDLSLSVNDGSSAKVYYIALNYAVR